MRTVEQIYEEFKLSTSCPFDCPDIVDEAMERMIILPQGEMVPCAGICLLTSPDIAIVLFEDRTFGVITAETGDTEAKLVVEEECPTLHQLRAANLLSREQIQLQGDWLDYRQSQWTHIERTLDLDTLRHMIMRFPLESAIILSEMERSVT